MNTIILERDFTGYTSGNDFTLLEESLRRASGAAHAIYINSPADSFSYALQASGVLPGDRVALPALAEGILLDAVTSLSASPVFVDINPNTFLIDPFCLRYVLSRCLRAGEPLPKAVICRNLFGMPCAYPEILDICYEFGISLIEGASGSLGGGIGDRQSGSFGRFSIVPISEGDGSFADDVAVLCKTLPDAAAIRRLARGDRLRKKVADRDRDFVRAAIIREKLALTGSNHKGRTRAAEIYLKALTPPLRPQQSYGGCESSWAQMAVLLPDEVSRDIVIEALTQQNIPCDIPFEEPLHRQSFFGGNRTILVNAESVCRRLITLPLHPYLTSDAIQHILDIINHSLEETLRDTHPSAVCF